MKICIASGKGGTGKTTVSSNLAYYFSKKEKVVLIDADVEEPNNHLFIKGDKIKEEEVSLTFPEIDSNKCNYCGECAKNCNYNAIAVLKDKVLIFEELCHSCGVCTYVCPEKAITEIERKIGSIEFFKDKNISLISGKLSIGKPMATPIIKKMLKYTEDDKINIIDAAPGTACSFVTSVYYADVVILVTENSPFGLYDLSLAYDVVKDLNKKTYLVINRYLKGFNKIEKYAEENNLEIISKIPEERKYAHTYSKGTLIIKEHPDFEKYMKDIERAIR